MAHYHVWLSQESTKNKTGMCKAEGRMNPLHAGQNLESELPTCRTMGTDLGKVIRLSRITQYRFKPISFKSEGL